MKRNNPNRTVTMVTGYAVLVLSFVAMLVSVYMAGYIEGLRYASDSQRRLTVAVKVEQTGRKIALPCTTDSDCTKLLRFGFSEYDLYL